MDTTVDHRSQSSFPEGPGAHSAPVSKVTRPQLAVVTFVTLLVLAAGAIVPGQPRQPQSERRGRRRRDHAAGHGHGQRHPCVSEHGPDVAE